MVLLKQTNLKSLLMVSTLVTLSRLNKPYNPLADNLSQ